MISGRETFYGNDRVASTATTKEITVEKMLHGLRRFYVSDLHGASIDPFQTSLVRRIFWPEKEQLEAISTGNGFLQVKNP